jgi:hypothetical protein
MSMLSVFLSLHRESFPINCLNQSLWYSVGMLWQLSPSQRWASYARPTSLCVYICIPLSILSSCLIKTLPRQRIPVALYAVCAVSKETRWLILPRNSGISISLSSWLSSIFLDFHSYLFPFSIPWFLVGRDIGCSNLSSWFCPSLPPGKYRVIV